MWLELRSRREVAFGMPTQSGTMCEALKPTGQGRPWHPADRFLSGNPTAIDVAAHRPGWHKFDQSKDSLNKSPGCVVDQPFQVRGTAPRENCASDVNIRGR
jgi:hypothetical protein